MAGFTACRAPSPLSLGPHGESATVTIMELGRRLLPPVQGRVVGEKDRAILPEAKGRKDGEESEMLALGVLCWMVCPCQRGCRSL